MEKIDSKENFIRLIRQYQNLVFSICLKLTGDYFAAEDLTQETFLSAYRHLEEFTGQAEKAWLCRIAGNKCVDYLREAALAHYVEGRTAAEIAAESGTGISTVKTQIYRAREQLKKSLGKELLKE